MPPLADGAQKTTHQGITPAPLPPALLRVAPAHTPSWRVSPVQAPMTPTLLLASSAPPRWLMTRWPPLSLRASSLFSPGSPLSRTHLYFYKPRPQLAVVFTQRGACCPPGFPFLSFDECFYLFVLFLRIGCRGPGFLFFPFASVDGLLGNFGRAG